MTACATPVVYVPLNRLALCVVCECCFAIAPVCPACGSEEIVALQRWLDRAPAA